MACPARYVLLEKQNFAPLASPSGPSGDTKHVSQYKFVMDPDVTAAQIIFLYQPPDVVHMAECGT